MKKLLVLAGVALICGCATVPGSSMRSPSITLPAKFAQHGVEIIVDGLYQNGYGTVVGVSGTATNLTARDLTMVMITLDVLGADRAKVSSAVASTTGLKAWQKWRFQATFMNPYMVAFDSIAPGNVLVLPAQ